MFDSLKDYFSKRQNLTPEEIEAEKLHIKKENARMHLTEFMDKFKNASIKKCWRRLGGKPHYLKEPSYTVLRDVVPNSVSINIECEFCGHSANESLPIDALEEVKKHFKEGK